MNVKWETYWIWICIQNYEISNRLKVKFLFLEEWVALKRAVLVPLKRADVELPSVFWTSTTGLLPVSGILVVLMLVVVMSHFLAGAGRFWFMLAFFRWSPLLQ